MGWSSAGDIFDPVAASLIEAGASNTIKRRVLGQLIDNLTMGDWDTQDESLRVFKDDEMIVALFAERGFKLAHRCPVCDRECGDQ